MDTAAYIYEKIATSVKTFPAKSDWRGIDHFSPHILRHTFCTNMESAGLNLKSLQYIMGHAQANTTLNTYTHSSAEMAAKHFKEIQENALKQAKIKQKI